MDKVERARDLFEAQLASEGFSPNGIVQARRTPAYRAATRAIEAALEPLAERGREADPDTIAFVQEWMMSGDHDPDQWHRDFAAAIDARSALSRISELESALRPFATLADWYDDGRGVFYPKDLDEAPGTLTVEMLRQARNVLGGKA